MPKLTGAAVAATAALLLALAGCAGTTQEPAGDTTKPDVSPTETAAPLVAETPIDTSAGEAEANFIKQVRAGLPANTQIPNATDQQLLDAGKAACERYAQGESYENMSVIEGETQVDGYYYDSAAIILAAVNTICPY